MINENLLKEMDEFQSLIAKELKKINTKGELTPNDLKVGMDILCLIEKMEKVQNGEFDDGFSNDSYSHNGSYNRYYSHNGTSQRRGRSPMTGRFVSRDQGYSGHSVHDRMIAALEELMDQAQSDYDREVITNGIRMIRQYEH